MTRRKLATVVNHDTDRNAAALAEDADNTFTRRWEEDLVRLASMIQLARQGDTSALGEVRRIARRIHGTSSLLDPGRVSASAEAIGQLASQILDDLDAHDPIAESALVRQLSEFIEGLTTSDGAPTASTRAQGARLPARRALAAAEPLSTPPRH